GGEVRGGREGEGAGGEAGGGGGGRGRLLDHVAARRRWPERGRAEHAVQPPAAVFAARQGQGGGQAEPQRVGGNVAGGGEPRTAGRQKERANGRGPPPNAPPPPRAAPP